MFLKHKTGADSKLREQSERLCFQVTLRSLRHCGHSDYDYFTSSILSLLLPTHFYEWQVFY